jgi:hypothetical protein
MDHCDLLYASFFIRLNFPHDDFFRRYPDSLAIPPDSDRIPPEFMSSSLPPGAS